MITENTTLYEYEKTAFPEVRKKMILLLALQYIFFFPLMLFMVYTIDQHSEKPTKDLFFLFGPALVGIIVAGYGFNKWIAWQKQVFESMRLSVSDHEISFSQLRHQPKIFRPDEISGIEIGFDREIHITDINGNRAVLSRHVKNYHQLIKQLQHIRPIDINHRKPIVRKMELPVNLVSLLALAALILSTDFLLVSSAMVIYACMTIAMCIYICRHKYFYAQYTRAIGFNLLVLCITGVLAYFKLTTLR